VYFINILYQYNLLAAKILLNFVCNTAGIIIQCASHVRAIPPCEKMATVPVLEANVPPLVRKRPADGSSEFSQQPANKRSVPDPGKF